jgi:hypothetical protein
VKTAETRKCSKCGTVHPLTSQYFSRNGTNADGTVQYWRPDCKPCNNAIKAGQNSAYKNCGSPAKPKKGTPCELCGRTNQQLLFDHCHDSLKHRGWICNSCNKGIGLLGDNVEALERVVLYLKRV